LAGLLILSIETSTGCGSVALTRGTSAAGHLLAEYTLRPDITHSRKLLGNIHQIMVDADVEWGQLDGLGVSLGPGSFTGLRIGLAAAKGIAMASGLPLVGVGSLDGLAQQCMGVDKPVWCVLDARKGQVYGACYRYNSTENRMIRKEEVAALAPELLLEKVTEPTLLTGPGIKPFSDLFTAHPLLTVLPEGVTQPRAATIGFLAVDQLEQGASVDPAGLTPLYARQSEAEINAKTKKNGRTLRS